MFRTLYQLLAHIRENYAYGMYALSFEDPALTMAQRHRYMIGSSVRLVLAVALCGTFGHDLESEVENPESGGEYVYCNRCGWSESVYHN